MVQFHVLPFGEVAARPRHADWPVHLAIISNGECCHLETVHGLSRCTDKVIRIHSIWLLRSWANMATALRC